MGETEVRFVRSELRKRRLLPALEDRGGAGGQEDRHLTPVNKTKSSSYNKRGLGPRLFSSF